MQEHETPILVRTLLAAGFEIEHVQREPNYLAFHAVRDDEFGHRNRYVLGYAGDSPISDADSGILHKLADKDRAALVIVSSNEDIQQGTAVLTKSQFFSKLGGIVSSVVPLEPDYAQQLETLASNKLPAGMLGTASDLFEAYVHAGLQFLLRGRVIRYGQERRFENVPDGLIIATTAPLMLYDCKAANERYEFTQTTIRQFADYIKKFHQRYESYIGRLHAFVTISDKFQSPKTLLERSNELYGESGVPLVCLTAEALGETVAAFADKPRFRSIVDWKSIFVAPLVESKKIREAIEARERDQVIRG